MRIEKKIRNKMKVGMIAMTLCMFTSSFAGHTIGEFPLWVIPWVLSMIAYGTLCGPVTAILALAAAKECEREKDDEA